MGFSVFFNALPLLFPNSSIGLANYSLPKRYVKQDARLLFEATSFERTARQTLPLSVAHIVPSDRIADSSVGLKIPYRGLLCDPKPYLICCRRWIPASATKWRIMLHLPGMLAHAAAAMRAGHSSRLCTFFPCSRVSSYTPENVACCSTAIFIFQDGMERNLCRKCKNQEAKEPREVKSFW